MNNKVLTLSEIQNESYKLLLKIKSICEKENIKYWLFWGTLLGAVRNNDFIPWDDDIDIVMPRDDYERFVDYCIKNSNELLPNKLFHYKTCKNYIYPISRFSNTEYKFISYVNDYGLGTFIDIYPFDGIDINDTKLINNLYKMKKNIGGMIAKKMPPRYGHIKFMIYKFRKLILSVRNLNKRLEKIDVISQKYKFDSSKYVCNVNWEPKIFFPRKCFEKTIYIKFHEDEFPAPYGYDELLKIRYGNYMELPPVEERKPHHDYDIIKK